MDSLLGTGGHWVRTVQYNTVQYKTRLARLVGPGRAQRKARCWPNRWPDTDRKPDDGPTDSQIEARQIHIARYGVDR